MLRAAGLAERLAVHGIGARDFGDLPEARHRPQPRVDGVRDLGRVSTVVAQTAERVSEIREAGLVPLIVGGDCTITLGVVGGVARREDAGLIYFDGDADLSLPATSGSGVLDTMGMTHLLGDGVPALSRSGPRFPLLRPGQVELFGFDPGELDTGEWSRLAGLGLHATPAPAPLSSVAGRHDDVRGLDHRGDLAALDQAELTDRFHGDRGDQPDTPRVQLDVGDRLAGGDAYDLGRDLVSRAQPHDVNSLERPTMSRPG